MPLPFSSTTNPGNPHDVNDDLEVTALDALEIVNSLKVRETHSSAFHMDVNRDNRVSALDALMVLNQLGKDRAVATLRLVTDTGSGAQSRLDRVTSQPALMGRIRGLGDSLLTFTIDSDQRQDESPVFVTNTGSFLLTEIQLENALGRPLDDGGYNVKLWTSQQESPLLSYSFTLDRTLPVLAIREAGATSDSRFRISVTDANFDFEHADQMLEVIAMESSGIVIDRIERHQHDADVYFRSLSETSSSLGSHPVRVTAEVVDRAGNRLQRDFETTVAVLPDRSSLLIANSGTPRLAAELSANAGQLIELPAFTSDAFASFTVVDQIGTTTRRVEPERIRVVSDLSNDRMATYIVPINATTGPLILEGLDTPYWLQIVPTVQSLSVNPDYFGSSNSSSVTVVGTGLHGNPQLAPNDSDIGRRLEDTSYAIANHVIPADQSSYTVRDWHGPFEADRWRYATLGGFSEVYEAGDRFVATAEFGASVEANVLSANPGQVISVHGDRLGSYPFFQLFDSPELDNQIATLAATNPTDDDSSASIELPVDVSGDVFIRRQGSRQATKISIVPLISRFTKTLPVSDYDDYSLHTFGVPDEGGQYRFFTPDTEATQPWLDLTLRDGQKDWSWPDWSTAGNGRVRFQIRSEVGISDPMILSVINLPDRSTDVDLTLRNRLAADANPDRVWVANGHRLEQYSVTDGSFIQDVTLQGIEHVDDVLGFEHFIYLDSTLHSQAKTFNSPTIGFLQASYHPLGQQVLYLFDAFSGQSRSSLTLEPEVELSSIAYDPSENLFYGIQERSQEIVVLSAVDGRLLSRRAFDFDFRGYRIYFNRQSAKIQVIRAAKVYDVDVPQSTVSYSSVIDGSASNDVAVLADGTPIGMAVSFEFLRTLRLPDADTFTGSLPRLDSVIATAERGVPTDASLPSANAGQRIVLKGRGFLPSTRVRFDGSHWVAGIPRSDGTEFLVVIPLDAESGQFWITDFETSDGASVQGEVQLVPTIDGIALVEQIFCCSPLVVVRSSGVTSSYRMSRLDSTGLISDDSLKVDSDGGTDLYPIAKWLGTFQVRVATVDGYHERLIDDQVPTVGRNADVRYSYLYNRLPGVEWSTELDADIASGEVVLATPGAGLEIISSANRSKIFEGSVVEFTGRFKTLPYERTETVSSSSTIVTVPPDMVSGTIKVVGASRPTELRFLPSLMAMYGDPRKPGSTILIGGKGLAEHARIEIDGIPAEKRLVQGDDQQYVHDIVAVTVPAGAQDGSVKVISDFPTDDSLIVSHSALTLGGIPVRPPVFIEPGHSLDDATLVELPEPDVVQQLTWVHDESSSDRFLAVEAKEQEGFLLTMQAPGSLAVTVYDASGHSLRTIQGTKVFRAPASGIYRFRVAVDSDKSGPILFELSRLKSTLYVPATARSLSSERTDDLGLNLPVINEGETLLVQPEAEHQFCHGDSLAPGDAGVDCSETGEATITVIGVESQLYGWTTRSISGEVPLQLLIAPVIESVHLGNGQLTVYGKRLSGGSTRLIIDGIEYDDLNTVDGSKGRWIRLPIERLVEPPRENVVVKTLTATAENSTGSIDGLRGEGVTFSLGDVVYPPLRGSLFPDGENASALSSIVRYDDGSFSHLRAWTDNPRHAQLWFLGDQSHSIWQLEPATQVTRISLGSRYGLHSLLIQGRDLLGWDQIRIGNGPALPMDSMRVDTSTNSGVDQITVIFENLAEIAGPIRLLAGSHEHVILRDSVEVTGNAFFGEIPDNAFPSANPGQWLSWNLLPDALITESEVFLNYETHADGDWQQVTLPITNRHVVIPVGARNAYVLAPAQEPIPIQIIDPFLTSPDYLGSYYAPESSVDMFVPVVHADADEESFRKTVDRGDIAISHLAIGPQNQVMAVERRKFEFDTYWLSGPEELPMRVDGFPTNGRFDFVRVPSKLGLQDVPPGQVVHLVNAPYKRVCVSSPGLHWNQASCGRALPDEVDAPLALDLHGNRLTLLTSHGVEVRDSIDATLLARFDAPGFTQLRRHPLTGHFWLLNDQGVFVELNPVSGGILSEHLSPITVRDFAFDDQGRFYVAIRNGFGVMDVPSLPANSSLMAILNVTTAPENGAVPLLRNDPWVDLSGEHFTSTTRFVIRFETTDGEFIEDVRTPSAISPDRARVHLPHSVDRVSDEFGILLLGDDATLKFRVAR
ncbi:dockerin type I domain-containing protein [Stieleria varia]|uniref:IPT/TIG domain protein n=1 Tax=Stieleria varia TaxID=2528005 RepID=A0A5C6B131_9BACT|nr:dockerin type I domain-containing protein [Stieleria varia]TWU06015.1 hypothetical protein Pla52n_17320 [Stieleria varia]